MTPPDRQGDRQRDGDPQGATRDAECMRRLRSQGAVLLGKPHVHEFALGGPGRDAYLGDARNPHDGTRMAGGSVRSPAALSGVIGYKPTYGTADLTGVVPSAWTRDHLGAFARDLDATPALAARCTDAATTDGSEGPESIRLGLNGTTFKSERSVRP